MLQNDKTLRKFIVNNVSFNLLFYNLKDCKISNMRLSLRLLSSVVRKRPFYITTPIFYVNAAPHIGHLYTAVVADAIQRFEKLIDPDCQVQFSTGTDEHGTKIQQAADKHKMPPIQYCDQISQEYKDLFDEYEIGYTDFVRTTEARHKIAVEKFWKKLLKNEYIYKAKYSGWYSVNDEAFVPESQTRDEVTSDGNIKVSIESGHKLEWTEETNYMFRLSAFKTPLQEWLSTDGVIQPLKYQMQLQEMVSRDAYLPDISVSRPADRVHWAIRVPGDEEQSIYVWLDALVNYLTVCESAEAQGSLTAPGWPADVQVIGKDILKFHGIYWPAFLMGSGRHPPRRLVCHGHWTVDGHKMSKSSGNVVSPRSTPAPSGLRYMMLREATMADDANFSSLKLLNISNSELADTLGNLAARVTGSALNPRAEHPVLRSEITLHPLAKSLMDTVDRLPEECHRHYSNYQFYKAVDAVIRTLHSANLFLETLKPWELVKKPECSQELDAVIHITLETLRICSIILQPVVPSLSNKLLDKLMIPKECRLWRNCEASWRSKDAIFETRKIQSGKFVLFPRIYVDKKDVQKKDVKKDNVQKKDVKKDNVKKKDVKKKVSV